MVCVMDKMALRQVLHQVRLFSCHCYSTNAPHSFIHISPMPHNHSFIHFFTNITQCWQLITSLTNTAKKSMFTEATRGHTPTVQTEKHKKLALGRTILDRYSQWMALNLRQLPIFQDDKSCVLQQGTIQPLNFRSINLLL